MKFTNLKKRGIRAAEYRQWSPKRSKIHQIEGAGRGDLLASYSRGGKMQELTVTERGYVKDTTVESHDAKETWSTKRDQ